MRLWCLRWEGLNPKLSPELSFLSFLHRYGCSGNSLKGTALPCTSNGAVVLEKSLKDVADAAVPDHLPLFLWCVLKISKWCGWSNLESSRFLREVFFFLDDSGLSVMPPSISSSLVLFKKNPTSLVVRWSSKNQKNPSTHAFQPSFYRSLLKKNHSLSPMKTISLVQKTHRPLSF